MEIDTRNQIMIMGQTIDKFSVSFPPFQKQVYVYGIFVVQIFSY